MICVLSDPVIFLTFLDFYDRSEIGDRYGMSDAHKVSLSLLILNMTFVFQFTMFVEVIGCKSVSLLIFGEQVFFSIPFILKFVS